MLVELVEPAGGQPDSPVLAVPVTRVTSGNISHRQSSEPTYATREHQRAGDPRRDHATPARADPARLPWPACRCRSPTAAWSCAPGRGRTCSTGWPPGTRTRASRLHVEEVPTPELGPGEALVAVMASAINYNTVWTSIFEPVSTFGFLRALRPALRADQAARPAVPRGRLRPGRRRAARRARA